MPQRRLPLDDQHGVVGRRRTSTDVYVRPRCVDHPMASDVVARDKVMNIQFIKWRTKPLSTLLLGEETLTCRVLTVEIMTKKVRAEQEIAEELNREGE